MSTQIQRAIDKIQVKDPIPVIDFTQHVLEDGTIISTQERVVKDVSVYTVYPIYIALLNYEFIRYKPRRCSNRL